MRKTTPPGAVISGRLADTILARLPVLARDLGPVAARSKRLASRYANTLRGGFAVGDWTELSQSRLIYLQAPASELDPALARLGRAIGCWDNRILVLLDDDLDCRALHRAAAGGACVASMAHIQIGQAHIAFVEGGAVAVSRLRTVLGRSGVRVIHLQPGDKSVFSAGLGLGRLVSCILLDSVVRSLRKAGIDPALSRKIAGWIADRSVAEVLTRGQAGAAARRLAVPVLEARQAEVLSARDARIGRFSRQLMDAVAEFYAEPRPGVSSSKTAQPPGTARGRKAAGI